MGRDGLPEDLLRRSPLDITKLYSPWPQHFPLRRLEGYDGLEELRPSIWGLACVLGDEANWDQMTTRLASFVKVSLKMDHEERPSAAEMLEHAFLEGPAAAKEQMPNNGVCERGQGCPEQANDAES